MSYQKLLIFLLWIIKILKGWTRLDSFSEIAKRAREVYIINSDKDLNESHKEFDMFIAEIEAKALLEAVKEFEHEIGPSKFEELSMSNGVKWTYIDEAWEHQGPYMDWLRNRAEELRTKITDR